MSIGSWACNYCAFYVMWFLCMWGVVYYHPIVVSLLVFGYLAIHLLVVSSCWLHELGLIIVVVAIGSINESILAFFHVVEYHQAWFLGFAWWVACLYACFATTLWHSSNWLLRRPWISSILGAIGMPFCYLFFLHEKMVQFPLGGAWAGSIIGMQYAVMVPMLCFVAKGMKSE